MIERRAAMFGKRIAPAHVKVMKPIVPTTLALLEKGTSG